LKVLKGKKIVEDINIKDVISGYSKVAVDVGTGDGRFAYKKARENPDTFYIGIDPAAENMMEFAAKIMKKPSKGGLNNVMYVVSGIEDLPTELYGIANKITVNLPWGSLLEGVAKGNSTVLDRLVSLAAHPEASLDMCFSYSILIEAGEMNRRELPELSTDYLKESLIPIYKQKGIKINELNTIDNDELIGYGTQWAKRLGFGRARDIYRISAVIFRR